MRSKFILFTTILALTLSLSNCKKKKSDPIKGCTDPSSSTYNPNATEDDGSCTYASAPAQMNTIAEVFAALGAQPQTLTVSATSAGTVTVNGVKIEVPANAFLTTSGSSTISGVANLTVKTILTKSEIILSGAGANSSNSKLIATKGCVKVTAAQNSQSLRLGGGGNFFVNVPDGITTPPPNKKFYAPKVTATDSTAKWALGTDVADIPIIFDGSKYQHHASLDSLKWLNAGVQWDSTAAVKVAVTASVTSSMFNNSNTAIYLSFNNRLIVGALFQISPGIFRISNMPQGVAVNMVGIAVINGQFYSAVQPMNINNTTVNLNMQPVSQATMLSQISALP